MRKFEGKPEIWQVEKKLHEVGGSKFLAMSAVMARRGGDPVKSRYMIVFEGGSEELEAAKQIMQKMPNISH
jgi:excinuclease UvrABC nuclease subunit